MEKMLQTEPGSLGAELSDSTAPLQTALRDLEGLADGFGRAMTTAFRRAAVDGKRLEDVLRSLARGLSSRALSAALAPISRGIGSAISGALGALLGMRFAKGGVIGPRVIPFAAGGVVATPSYFPMPGGMGLVGEAGPEAILPLARGADGRLGVRAAGGGAPVRITFNVTTPDADSFRRAETELSAMLARAVARGRRGL
jgi:phage-related minor tail protein